MIRYTLPLLALAFLNTPAQAVSPPVAHCGMASYTLLDTAQVGELLEWEEIDELSLSARVIDALLADTDLDVLTPVDYGVRVFRYRYTTQDRGVSVEATSMLVIPTHRPLGTGGGPEALPTMLYLHGTTGYSDPCAPSASLEAAGVAALIGAQGYITVVPDFIGMNGFGDASTTTHGYLIGEQTAIGSWDALRAGETLLDVVSPRPWFRANGDVAIWGASQGGHASLFTELYGPYYAPEYTVKGIVASVPPSDLFPLLSYGASDMVGATGFLSAALVAQQAWYGAPSDLTHVFTNEDPYYIADNAYDYIFVEEECNPGDGLEVDAIEDLFVQSFIDAAREERWEDLQPYTCFFEASSLATSPVIPLRFTPTLMQYSELDEVVLTESQKPDFDRLCDQGYQLEYLECAGGDHVDGALWSLPEQLDWLDARLAGQPISPEKLCQRSAPICCSASPTDVCTP